ncbi:hypothetical protein MVEN_01890300 [Mycena venus]|uniref:Uncharacterized protein n=1 Tax=Mycena venus TaxID=2733690 RepID=A0A8H6XJA3_9AGAR|nr:hypothetical protein MVEN_01890300 [Mycena venus]
MLVAPLGGLPLELERKIFEMVAHARPLCIPNLMLVAWRVKEWVEPLLYRTLVFGSFYDQWTLAGHPVANASAFVSVIYSGSKHASFFADTVRHLHMASYTPLSAVILSVCSGVEDLWIGGTDFSGEMLHAIFRLPLKRLYCDITDLFNAKDSLAFTTPSFSNLTHLELMPCAHIRPEVVSDLSRVPCLSHLAFDHDDHLHLSPLTLLRTCVSLRVLIGLLLHTENEELWVDHGDLKQLAEDPRYVRMLCASYTADWQMGAHEGIDYWSRAEAFIAKRISREVDPLQYFIEGDESESLSRSSIRAN